MNGLKQSISRINNFCSPITNTRYINNELILRRVNSYIKSGLIRLSSKQTYEILKTNMEAEQIISAGFNSTTKYTNNNILGINTTFISLNKIDIDFEITYTNLISQTQYRYSNRLPVEGLIQLIIDLSLSTRPLTGIIRFSISILNQNTPSHFMVVPLGERPNESLRLDTLTIMFDPFIESPVIVEYIKWETTLEIPTENYTNTYHSTETLKSKLKT